MYRVLLRGPRPLRKSDIKGRRIAIGAMTMLLAAAATAGAGDAASGRGSRSPATALPLASLISAAGPFQASAARIAPLDRPVAGEWYNHFSHFAVRPERVAAFEPAHTETRLASIAPEKTSAKGASALPKLEQGEPTGPLAFADPSPKAEGGALAAIRSIAPAEGDDETGIDIGALQPGDVPLPEPRPDIERDAAEKPAAKPDKAAAGDSRGEQKDRKEPEDVAVARPAKPEASREPSSGGFLQKLFGGSRTAGNGVAVYDISAKKVYMPDGTVLAAASGIGKMANNPKYAHVKMNGPTPPHTYNLRMRETRFHGVEAIRMLPVDGKNKYGRDGFLTHTQLLRGRPGQSHGCVAFADYGKFLTAFKQGKVKQMVVVASGGRAAAVRMAQN